MRHCCLSILKASIKFTKRIIEIFLAHAWLYFLGKSNFINLIREYEFEGVPIGDCVFSSYLRGDRSAGLIAFNWGIVLKFATILIRLEYLKELVARYELSAENKIFYANETAYFPEAARRLLVRKGYREIRYNQYDKKYTLINCNQGNLIHKNPALRSVLYALITDKNLKQAEVMIEKLVKREITYDYMRHQDIDPNCQVHNDLFHFEKSKKNVVIYMHAVSDAQYFYGRDCFLDLHDWLMKTILILREYNFDIFLKLHPCFYNREVFYTSDKRYLQKLGKDFNIDLINFPSNGHSIGKFQTHFLGPSYSILDLKGILHDPLIITHHGTIAIEASFVGLQVICSSSSPYIKGLDRFVDVYDNLKEYRYLVQNYKKDVSHNIRREDLFRFFYVEYVLKDKHSIFTSPYGNHYLDSEDPKCSIIKNASQFNDFLKRNSHNSAFLKIIRKQLSGFISHRIDT
jgi:hypothetical protein